MHESDKDPVGGERWIQVDLVVERPSDVDAAWSVVLGWWEAAMGASDDGRSRFAWLLRKPPGLRLRMAASGAEQLAALDARLETLLGCGAGSTAGLRWSRGIYEPESHRFGGPAGASAAHTLLTGSTAAWIQWERARRGGQATLDAPVAALAGYDDFVRRIASDGAEQWDVWCRMAELYFGIDAVPGLGRWSGLDLGRVCDARSTAEASALAAMRRGNARCAQALEGAVRSGATRIGPRAFAVTLATFHWNIWAIDRTALRRAIELMVSELDPIPARMSE